MSLLRDVLPLVFAVLALLGWYLSYTASRLDRLHHKVIASRAALDVQLVRRGEAAIDAARHQDPASALLLTDAATRALAAGERAETREQADPLDVPPDLEDTQNDLSRALQQTYPTGWRSEAHDAAARSDDPVVAPLPDPFAQDAAAQLATACHRVQLARRFHNDAVAQAQRVRRKRVVRWGHLAGRAPMPQMIEFDDAVPPGLGSILGG